MKEWDEVTLYDYLPIKYRYPLNNCITVLGPKNLTDSNCNLLSFYDFKKADMLINNLKNKKEYDSSWGWHSKFSIDTATKEFHKKIARTADHNPGYIRYFFPLWVDVVEKNLDISIDKNYIQYCDNNHSILDQATYSIFDKRPKFCLILLDSWLKVSVLGQEISLTDVNSNNEVLTQEFHSLSTDYINLNQTIFRPFFDKLSLLQRSSKEIGTQVIIAQSIHPFEGLGHSHPHIWYMFNEIFKQTKNTHNQTNNDSNLHFIGWPFIPECDGEILVTNKIETTIPFCYNLPNEKGHQEIAERFIDKINQIPQRLI